MNGWRGGVLISLALLLGGCARLILTPPAVKIDHNIRFDATSRDAIVVFGFYGQFNVQIIEAVDDGVNLRKVSGGKFVWRAGPENGFVAVRLPARMGKDKYAIAELDAGGGVAEYWPARNQPIWVFNAEPGRVNYVGALCVSWIGDVLALGEDREVTAQHADDFVTQTFPNIRDHIVARPMQWIYTGLDWPDLPLGRSPPSIPPNSAPQARCANLVPLNTNSPMRLN